MELIAERDRVAKRLEELNRLILEAIERGEIEGKSWEEEG